MRKFVEIVDSNECKVMSNLVVNGIKGNSEEWVKYNFFPNNGVVAAVLGERMTYDGQILVVQPLPGIIVPIGPLGVNYITENEFNIRLQDNKTLGQDLDGKNETARIDEMVNSILNYK